VLPIRRGGCQQVVIRALDSCERCRCTGQPALVRVQCHSQQPIGPTDRGSRRAHVQLGEGMPGDKGRSKTESILLEHPSKSILTDTCLNKTTFLRNIEHAPQQHPTESWHS
jgi:hypothetical protein